MHFFTRFPIIFWFVIIALLTSASISYYTFRSVFNNQITETKNSELKRINQRMIQLQGTVNDFNRRHNYNAIHREVSRLSNDPTTELILITDEHGNIKYSSSLEYRNTALNELPEIHKLFTINDKLHTMSIIEDESKISGSYPLDNVSHPGENTDFKHAYILALFDLSQTLNELRYRQQLEIIQITLIHFTLLFSGFFFLYLGMRSRIRSITTGIKQFSDGDFDSRIALTGRDEFSRISSGFDVMASKLQTQNQSLINLTHELSTQHKELLHQEQDLRITLNSIGDAVIATNSEGLITRMNPVAQTLTGWNINDAKDKPITSVFNIINASTRETIENPIEKVIQTGQTVYLSNNTTLISRNGNEYHISDSAAPIRNEDNTIQGMVLIFNNITEQYRLRQAAIKSELILSSIMDNSPAIIYVKNSEGVFTYINQQFLSVFHLKRDDVIGKKLHDLFPREIADEMQANDRTVLSSGETLEKEELAPQDDGVHAYTSIKFPLMDETGNIYAVCGISTDITLRKQQEQLLRRSNKMDALGKLTGGIAHDYNNMLGIIIGYSELLKEILPNTSEAYNFAHEILHASQRGANLTRKLLTFSRPQHHKNQPLDLNDLLLDRRDMLAKVLTARIKLDMKLDNNLWPIWINSGDLEDAIVNISINAMHAMENGGHFTIETKNKHVLSTDASQLQIEQGDYIQIDFTDTGIGMDKEIQEKIFDPFFTSKGDLGAGLGLSQVYGLVQSNGGAIKVYSEAGHGTRITIYLPRYLYEEDDTVITNTPPLINLKGSETILVVDDEPGLRALSGDILRRNGYRVILAENGQQALEILASETIDILFSDVIMPEMDGLELARRAKQDFPTLKIQLTSGFNDNHYDKSDDACLHRNILSKPFTSQQLLQKIKDLIQQ
ncbi:MAG: PAS domain-containing protein [Gammaproteobacteria bacterium]|nr:PAS domain-containing protein [Gammaproteobacteria bacterium]